MSEILKGTELTCRQIIDFVQAYIDDELPPRERRIFDLHLALCPDCFHYLESYQATRQLAQQTREFEGEPPEIPADLVQAILATRREQPHFE